MIALFNDNYLLVKCIDYKLYPLLFFTEYYNEIIFLRKTEKKANKIDKITVTDSSPDMPEVMAAVELLDEPDLSTFENKTGLAEDMKFLASMPELCDVTFLVGDTREPVCAVKAVLAARSRYV